MTLQDPGQHDNSWNPGGPAYAAQPPPKQTHKLRNGILIGVGALVALVVVAAALGSPSSKPTAAKTPVSATTPSAAAASTYSPPPTQPPPAPPSCAQQASTWVNGLGGTEMNTVENDMEQTGTDATAGDVAAVGTDLTTLENDSQVLQGNMPPSCVPGLDRHLNRALNDYEAAASAFNNAQDIAQATADLGDGNTQIQMATTAVKTFVTS